MLSRARVVFHPVVLALVLAAACSSAPALQDISSPDSLKTRFNDDAGKTRIILLLSPT